MARSAAFTKRASSVGEDVDVFPAGDVEDGAMRQEVEAGARQVIAAFPDGGSRSAGRRAPCTRTPGSLRFALGLGAMPLWEVPS